MAWSAASSWAPWTTSRGRSSRPCSRRASAPASPTSGCATRTPGCSRPSSASARSWPDSCRRRWRRSCRALRARRSSPVIAETAEPEELLDVLREYHAAMGARIIEHEGTLEHFAGDGLHVWFNDPVEQADHALRAVRMAVAMRDDVAQLSAGWARRGYDLGFGVGISTGFATAGRIGYEGRYDYAAIGNAVVIAARLSGKATNGQVLVSQRTLAAVD